MAKDQQIDQDILDGLTEEERLALQDDDTDTNAGGTDEDDPRENEDDGADGGDDDASDDTGAAADDTAAAGRDDGAVDDEPEGQASAPAQQAPILVAEPPADADAKLKEIADKRGDLRKQYDDGDITFDEYDAQKDALAREEREIERAIDKANLAAEMEQQRQKNEWLGTVNSFIAANDIYNPATNPRLYRALDLEVRDVAVSEEGKSMSGQQILERAHANLSKEFGFTATKTAKQPEARKPAKAAEDLPPSLHAVPASDVSETGGNRFAWLDRLQQSDGVKYEEALGKLSPSEYDAYMAQ